jgi:hypothetical protein
MALSKPSPRSSFSRPTWSCFVALSRTSRRGSTSMMRTTTENDTPLRSTDLGQPFPSAGWTLEAFTPRPYAQSDRFHVALAGVGNFCDLASWATVSSRRRTHRR